MPVRFSAGSLADQVLSYMQRFIVPHVHQGDAQLSMLVTYLLLGLLHSADWAANIVTSIEGCAPDEREEQ